MKRFIIRVFGFLLVIVISFLLLGFLADGNTDAFYIRFTSPQQSNLILGTSRAAQGIQPRGLQKELDRSFFNYSFTIVHSPFGPVYLKSIQKKIDPNEKDGIFIVSVDPWSICSESADVNDPDLFRENDLCLANTPYVNCKPNYIYIFRNLRGKYFSLLRKEKTKMYLHNDGWLEVNPSMNKTDQNRRIANKVKDYREEHLPTFKFSSFRLNYLIKTVQLLSKHGSVYLVRLPIHEDLMEIENELMPDFNDRISQIASMTDGYLDLTDSNTSFVYTDGNHLYKESGKKVSQMIAEWIGENQKNQ